MSTGTFINIKTLTYPVYEYDIRLEYPDMGETFVCPEEYKEVIASDRPEVSQYQKLIQGFPVEVNGEWYQNWIVESNSMNPNDIVYSEVTGGPIKAPRIETVWIDQKIYRTAYSRALPEGFALHQELEALFPDDMPIENRRDPNWIGKSLGSVREPYTNDTYSLYVWFTPLPETYDKFNVVITPNMMLAPWYGLKYDSVTKEIMFKLPYAEKVPETPKPEGLPDGGFFGKIYKKDGSIDPNVDYYVNCDASIIREFCTNNDVPFPVPEEHLEHVVVYGIVYDIDTMKVSVVKGYDLRCPL